MIHTFDRAGVARLLAHTRAAPKHRPLYGRQTAKPGLWLVGDDGVYLLSNGDPGLTRRRRKGEARSDHPPMFVVYADEVNPLVLGFDQWWTAKNAGFGGDDGIDFLPAETLEKALWESAPSAPLQLDITAEGISVLVTRRFRPANEG